MVISYNAKLNFPSKETESRYKEVLEFEKDCYNYLSQIFDRIDFKHHKLSRYDVQSEYYKELREKFPLLSSQMVLKAILESVGNWTTCIANEKDDFESPTKKNLSMVLDKRLYNNLTRNTVDLTIPGFKRVRCTIETYEQLDKLFEVYRPQNCNIFYRNGQFFLTIQFDVPEIEHIEGEALGVDRGIRRIVTCSDGTGWVNRAFNRERRKLRYLRRCLQAKNTKSAKRHLKKLSKTERNRSKNEVHRIVNWLLAKDYTTYVLEDLSKIKKSTSKKTIKIDGKNTEVKRKKHNNRFGQIPLKEIQTTLEYKAPLLGKEVVTVEPAYTSRLDYRGFPEGKRLGTRYYASDGELLDADGNGACNIVLRHRPDSIVVKPIYGSMVFFRQVDVNRPIVAATGSNRCNYKRTSFRRCVVDERLFGQYRIRHCEVGVTVRPVQRMKSVSVVTDAFDSLATFNEYDIREVGTDVDLVCFQIHSCFLSRRLPMHGRMPPR